LRPSRTHRIATLLVAMAVIAAGGWVTKTPLFDMRTLTVSGNRHLSDAEVARLAGLSRKTNVLWLRTGALAGRIERDPWILRAQVSRTLPGSVTVSIQERRPVAVAEAGRSMFMVSGDGVILGRASPKARLPAIALPGVPVTTGSRIPGSPAVLIVARSLPAAVRGTVARIIQTGRRSLNLILRDGTQVLYGDGKQADAKGRALTSLLSWARARGVRADYIDVRAPGAPAILPAGAVASP
jgi:cell division protein FtsQ